MKEKQNPMQKPKKIAKREVVDKARINSGKKNCIYEHLIYIEMQTHSTLHNTLNNL